jgi:hypothetical protein
MKSGTEVAQSRFLSARSGTFLAVEYSDINADFMEFFEVVAGGGIEPPTQGFSVLCSTN